MTSPLHSPHAFHARGICEESLGLPPRRHLVYACNVCHSRFPVWRNLCHCHPSAILHAIEVDAAEYARLKARSH